MGRDSEAAIADLEAAESKLLAQQKRDARKGIGDGDILDENRFYEGKDEVVSETDHSDNTGDDLEVSDSTQKRTTVKTTSIKKTTGKEAISTTTTKKSTTSKG